MILRGLNAPAIMAMPVFNLSTYSSAKEVINGYFFLTSGAHLS